MSVGRETRTVDARCNGLARSVCRQSIVMRIGNEKETNCLYVEVNQDILSKQCSPQGRNNLGDDHSLGFLDKI